MKTCPKCQSKKPLVDFHKNSSRRDGLAFYCKSCVKSYTDDYYTKNKEKVADSCRRWRLENPDKRAEYAKRHRMKYPAEVKARNVLNQAVRSGRISKESCESCGSEANVEAHHHKGYDEHYALDVKWLCSLCHKEEHRRVL